MIHAINDKNIDCFKDSDVSWDLERLLCNAAAQRSFTDLPTCSAELKKKSLNVNFTLLLHQV